jgi:hypothetical protein
MKSKYVIIASSIIDISKFCSKDETKAAEKALKRR